MSEKQNVSGGMVEAGADADGDGLRKSTFKSLGVKYMDEWDGIEEAVNRIHEKYKTDDFSDETFEVTTDEGDTFTISVTEIEDMGVLDTLRQYTNDRDRFLGMTVVGEWDDHMVLHYESKERLQQMVGASIIAAM